MQDNPNWLQSVKDQFNEKGVGGGDLYYLLETMIPEGKMTFPQFLSDAGLGQSCKMHEGLSMSLDQDWDNSEAFDEVNFFYRRHRKFSAWPCRIFVFADVCVGGICRFLAQRY